MLLGLELSCPKRKETRMLYHRLQIDRGPFVYITLNYPLNICDVHGKFLFHFLTKFIE